MMTSEWIQQSNTEIQEAKQELQRMKQIYTLRGDFASFIESCYEGLEDVGKRVSTIENKIKQVSSKGSPDPSSGTSRKSLSQGEVKQLDIEKSRINENLSSLEEDVTLFKIFIELASKQLKEYDAALEDIARYI